MSRITDVFARMKASKSIDWVGDGDPVEVGSMSLASMIQYAGLTSQDNVFDFGCGVGRASLPLADYLTGGRVVGVDIAPEPIGFCQKNIASLYENSMFHVLADSNPFYDTKPTDNAVTPDQIAQLYPSTFDLVCAFSVFTHLDETMTVRYLNLFSKILRPSGMVFITTYLDSIDNPDDRRITEGGFRDVYPDQPLHMTMFTPAAITELLHRADMQVCALHYGRWRPSSMRRLPSPQFQDVVVAARRPLLPHDFSPDRYLLLHDDVRAAGMDPGKHYLDFGYAEGRRY